MQPAESAALPDGATMDTQRGRAAKAAGLQRAAQSGGAATGARQHDAEGARPTVLSCSEVKWRRGSLFALSDARHAMDGMMAGPRLG